MNGTNAVKCIDDMIGDIEKLRFTDCNEALRVSFYALELSKENNYPQAEAILLFKIGSIYSNISEYSKGIEYIVTAMPMLELYNLDYQICQAFTSLGNTSYDLANYETAYGYYSKSVNISKRSLFTDQLSIAYNNIGEVYKVLLNYDKALDYYEKSLNEDKKIGYKACKGLTYVNLAEINYLKGDYEKSLELVPTGLSLLNKYEDEILVCEAYKVFALDYWKLGDIEKATDNFKRAIKISSDKMAYYYNIDILVYYHQFLLEQNQTDSAIKALSEAYDLALSNNLREKTLQICRCFTEIYANTNEHEMALKYYRLYVSHDQELYKERTGQINEGIELRIKTEEIRLQSEIDVLTGVPNRRKFLQYLDKQWAHSKKRCHSLALVMIDIDYFKEYNDSYGHPEGDKCLIKIARLLSGLLGKNYLLARYGGDEFIVVLPQTGLNEALSFAETMRQAVAGAKLGHPRSPISESVTITLGVTALIPTDDRSINEIIKKADDALYEAKRKGRNKSIGLE